MTGTGLIPSEQPPADRFDLALVDLDGVAYRGHLPIPWAAESVVAARGRGMHVVFVTNNASRAPEAVAHQLDDLGMPTAPTDVLTAAQSAANLLSTRLSAGARVLVVGADALRTAVREAGFVVVDSADD